MSINMVNFLTPSKKSVSLSVKENLYQVLLELSLTQYNFKKQGNHKNFEKQTSLLLLFQACFCKL